MAETWGRSRERVYQLARKALRRVGRDFGNELSAEILCRILERVDENQNAGPRTRAYVELVSRIVAGILLAREREKWLAAEAKDAR